MINKALQLTNDILDKFLKTRFDTQESKVIVGSQVSADGTVPATNANKIVLSLINVERTSAKAPISFGYKSAVADKPAVAAPTGNYTLYILACTNFADYATSLDYLDATISFFAEHMTIEAANHPEMPAGMSKIEYAMESVAFEQMLSIWMAIGAKYQPSVVYKVSVISA